MHFPPPNHTILRIAVAAVALCVGGCNTVQGMGKDLGNAGTAISNTAEKTKEKM